MILICVKNNIDRFIKKNIKNNINMYDLKRDNNLLYVRINENDLKQIKKINYYSKIKVVKEFGFKSLAKRALKHYYDFFMMFLFLGLIFIASNIIVKVEIKHENKEIVKYVEDIIKKKNIKKYTYQKNLKELNAISDEIMFKHKDKIDWISINRVGMKYIVSIEERIKNKEESTLERCHIIAKRDGVISNIVYDKGVSLVENGALVKKGDILISGEIKLNETVKENTCANGDIFAETWYKINISYPLDYSYRSSTGKSRYNFLLNGNYFYKDHYKAYDEYKVFKILDLYIIKEVEMKEIKDKFTTAEAKDNALKESRDKLFSQIGSNCEIKSEKVLKEYANNSKIELEVFYSVIEQIGKRVEYEVSDENDSEQNI